MKAQLDNKIISSFLLMVDHVIQETGSAYSNTSSLFYPIPSDVRNTYAYASPFKQFSNDLSVSGATIMSGVYLNNNFVMVGQSGLKAINHYQGTVYFTGQLPAGTVVSGNFALKEFNIELIDRAEWKLLFDTKFVDNNRDVQNFTGISLETKTAPGIFIRTKNQDNKPFSLGGMDSSEMKLRAIVIADNEYQKIAAVNILKRMNYRPIPIVVSTPFNSLGMMTGLNYNYNQLVFDSDIHTWILGVKAIDIPQEGQFKNIPRNMAMVDYDISTILKHS